MASWKRIVRVMFSSVFLQVGLLTFFFWLYHKLAVYVMSTLRIKLGYIKTQAAPLYANLRINFNWWIIPAILTLSAYLIIFRIFFEKRKVPAHILLFACVLFAILINTTVAMIDGGLKSIERPYTRAGIEYYDDVPKVVGLRVFLRDYTKMLPELSLHSKRHPPGGVLFLWIVSKLFGKGVLTAAFMTIIFTSLSLIPVYLLAKGLYGESVAKYTLGLFLITPNMVMFTATAMDGPFSVFPILSMYLFYKALKGSTYNLRALYSILTGVALSFGMLMNYTTVIIGIFFIVITMITLFAKREHVKVTLRTLLIAGGTFAFFYLVLYLWAGYNLLDAIRSSYALDESDMGTGYENFGRYFHVSIANLFAFLIGVGIPTTTIWIREVINEFRRLIRHLEVDIYILACLVTLLVASFSTLFTLEVERIWLFMVPFIVIPAAKHLSEFHRPWKFYAIASLLCVQLLLCEIFLNTHW